MAFAEVVQQAFASNAEMFGVVGVGWRVERGVGAGRVVAQGTEGRERAPEDSAPLSPQQKWHWGSCTKALTATVVASLVDAGTFRADWETRLGDLFQDLVAAAEPRLAGVTLLQLASHRGGVCLDLELAEEEALRAGASAATPSELRAAFMRRLAERRLECDPGESFGYSNAGYVALAAAAEAASGEAWEDIVRRRLAEPLGMHSFGFGTPPRGGKGEGAVGHDEDGDVDEAQDAPWHSASFSVHSSLEDWAKFAGLHLSVLRGDASALGQVGVGAATAAVLQTPVSPASAGEKCRGPESPLSMALGWQCLWEEPADGHQESAAPTGLLYHWGTNFRFQAGAYLQAEPPLMILAGSNSGSSLARLACRTAFEATIAAAAHEDGADGDAAAA